MPENYYTNLCNNVRSTDDISFKLLGLVPLFSGSGLLLAVLKSDYFWSPAIYAIAAFGALITLGLFRWELRNIQTCSWLIRRGADVEEAEDEQKAGQFYRRTAAPLGVGKTEAEKLIYGATTFTWLLLPWVVYSTAQVKKLQPELYQNLYNVYLIFAAVVGLFTLLSMFMPVSTAPKAQEHHKQS